MIWLRAAWGFVTSEVGIYAMIGAAAFWVVGTQWNYQSLVTVPRVEAERDTARAETIAERGKLKDAQAAALKVALLQAEKDRATERFWQGKVDDAVEDGNRRVSAAEAGRAAVSRELVGMRRTAADLAAAARRTPTGAPAPPECAPAIAASDLQSDMLRRVSEAAAVIAGFADGAHPAGLVCERGWPLNPTAASAPRNPEPQP